MVEEKSLSLVFGVQNHVAPSTQGKGGPLRDVSSGKQESFLANREATVPQNPRTSSGGRNKSEL